MILLTKHEAEEAINPMLGLIQRFLGVGEKVTGRDAQIAKAQLKKVAEWGNEKCPHIVDLGEVGTMGLPNRACVKCWQALLKEVE